MKKTRAERRYRNALLKQKICKRHDYTITDFSKTQPKYRKIVRNDGRWRHPGKKPWYGCGANCWYCNPQIVKRVKIKKIEKDMFVLDIIDLVTEHQAP
jgi:hypothetical protein